MYKRSIWPCKRSNHATMLIRIISQQSEDNIYRHHYMFRTHPDINTARMTFNHQLSIEWQVCTPPHFNLQYTQHGLLSGPKLFASGL